MENYEEESKKSRRFSDLGLKNKLSSANINDLFKSPRLDMFAKKRKRRGTDLSLDEDNVSLHSVDLGNIQKESATEKKRRRSMSKLSSSLVNIFSPQRASRKLEPENEEAGSSSSGGGGGGGSILRSLSLKNLMSPQSKHKSPFPDKNSVHQDTPYKAPRPSTPKRRRESEFWHQTVNDFSVENYDKLQLRRQEAIYELFKGEADMIEDLDNIKKNYRDPMKALGLMSPEELELIFSHFEDLTPPHQALVNDLKEQRLTDGTTEFVGEVIVNWVPQLRVYINYCSNQVFAKSLLDFKKQDPSVEDFLERCQESPFSRRLDLWSFLDLPRSKMVKYPLLFKAIQKCTPEEHSDYQLLSEATDMVEELIQEVDERTGEAKCRYTKEKLDYLEDKQRSTLIDDSQAVLCDGILKNNRGTKLYVFLFEKILVLTRPATRGGKLKYQLYRQPIPLDDLVLEDADSDGKLGGSFRSAFTQGQPVKHMFKVSFATPGAGQSHTLQANDEHDRKQWTSAIRSVLPVRPEQRASADGTDLTLDDSCSTPGRGPITRQSSRTSIMSFTSISSTSSAASSINEDSNKKELLCQAAIAKKLSKQGSKSKLSQAKQAGKCKLAKQISKSKGLFRQNSRGSKRRFSFSKAKREEPNSPPMAQREEADGADE